MKKISIVLLMCLLLLFTMGFVKKGELILTSVEPTVIKTERILRYDFRIKNTGSQRIISTFDYPGNHLLGLEVTVRPNDKLASLMVMSENTGFRKMQLRGSGSAGIIEPGKESSFHVEFQIKENVEVEKVKSTSLDGVLLILDGPKIIAEIPLTDSINKNTN
ncbi:hypothetical protein BC351_40135 [Paenibacillus ferrarius]|uniref:DUF4352 domain-containing protein n=3 Tax=Paenibacillus ferrarius TaxID=1469647 RepID=A0A1V4H852_9BACL|nr:hypothetical protein [Paenibacillus ferrarius]OPH47389.1 hypothetical protein BC351_40135 [Paenibacillus ferrarius]